MGHAWQYLGPTLRIETLLRLYTVALAGLLLVLDARHATQELVLLSTSYAAISICTWVLSRRVEPSVLGLPMALADVAAVTAFSALLSGAGLPAWPLYLFPLAVAAPSGRVATMLAGGLSVLGYLAIAPAVSIAQSARLWPAVVIGAATLAATLLSNRWQAERLERRAWREVVAAARAVLDAEQPPAVAAVIVERARRLLRADRAGMWRWDGSGRFDPYEVKGTSSHGWLDLEHVPSSLQRKLRRGTVSLEELDPSFRDQTGDAVLLRHHETVIALLAVAWNRPPHDRRARRQALRMFASWAAEALARARARLEIREELRRERTLRQAAAAMSASVERSELYEALVHAARTGAGARACLVERSSGRGLAGDQALAEALVRQAIDGEPSSRSRAMPAGAAWLPRPCVALIDSELALLVARDDPAINEEDRAWIEELAQVARQTLERFAVHDQLQQALRAKDELISLVGHELRTPLTSIHGYSQMMARQLRTVEQQVDQLNRLIGDLMDASQMEGGHLNIQRAAVDVVELARAAAERFRARHSARPLRLGLTDSAMVEGDGARLGQVLDNLLDNAAKYSPQEREIDLIVESDALRTTVSIRDYGVGIAAEHLPHLFDRFYRAPGATTARVRGFGLGLSIVRDLVAAHGGNVWAESNGPGQGSTFSVVLPRAARGEPRRKLNARAG